MIHQELQLPLVSICRLVSARQLFLAQCCHPIQNWCIDPAYHMRADRYPDAEQILSIDTNNDMLVISEEALDSVLAINRGRERLLAGRVGCVWGGGGGEVGGQPH